VQHLKPLVSIIIVNYNGKDHLIRCLESVRTTITSNTYEIIVVDNKSTDGSRELIIAKFPEVRLIELESNLGFAYPNNIGVEKSKGSLLVFLNNDTFVTPNWLNELIKCLDNDEKVAIAQSLLLKPDGRIDSSGDFVDKLGRPYNSKVEDPPDGRPILSARAAAMIIRRDVFLELGAFEPDFFASFEDVHLGWNAWIAGYKAKLASKSIVYHIGGQTVKKIEDKMNFHGVKNQALLILLDLEFFQGISNLLILFFQYILKKIGMRSSEHYPKLSNISVSQVMKALGWIITHYPSIMRKRKLVNNRRVLSTKELRKMGLITDQMFEK